MSVETTSASVPDANSAPQPQLSAAHPAAVSTAAPAIVHRCENCGAAVISRFCPDCGQRTQHATYSVWHFLREATEDLTHADSRLWRTLGALLARPGYLTREFFEGRRARYLPPIRLYLVLSVLFFLTPGASSVDQHSHVAQPSAARSGEQATPQSQGVHPNCEWIRYEGPASAWLEPRLKEGCYRVAADRGHGLEQQFVHNLPRALFVFLPLLAFFMMLMYWWPRRYYVEHLLFFVHNHAAVFLLLTLSWLVRTAVPWHAFHGLVSFAVWVYVPVYLYRSMRRVYGQGRWLTSLKFLTLGFAYLVTGAVMLGLVAAYSFLTL